jgi:AraC-like DNA-binding protein
LGRTVDTEFLKSGWAPIRWAQRERKVKTSARGSLRSDDSYEPQLVINELALPPGGEWSPQLPGWLVIHVSSGVGYWLHTRLNWELPTGTVLLLSDQIQGCVRASQVGELRLHFFRTEPGRLTGLMSMADQTLMQNAAGDEKSSLRVIPPNTHFSDKIRELSSEKARNSFPARVQLLQLFLEVFGGTFQYPQAEVTGVCDATERLRQILNQTPVSELLELSFSELASKTRCSPRHVSRLFTELVGVSFREKQAELRLARARELLATTDSKVVEVALESGYQSTSLFSTMFKQRFGVSPAKWRDQAKGRKPAKHAVRRLRLAA